MAVNDPQAPQSLADSLTSALSQDWMVVLAMLAILLLTPVMLPAASAIGMDVIHFGTLMVVTLTMGLYALSGGTMLFIFASFGRVPILHSARGLAAHGLRAGLAVDHVSRS